jgi:hypothetical protein
MGDQKMRRTSILTAVAVTWGVCGMAVVRAEDRGEKTTKSAVTFRMATSTPAPDFEKMTLDDGQTVYVSPRVTFTSDEVVTALPGEARNGLDLTITADAAERIGRTPTDRLAVFVNGRLSAAPKVDEADEAGRVVISDLTATQLQRVSYALGVTSDVTGATMRVVPRQTSAQPGDLVTVDVFVSGVPNLRTFQFGLDALGGRAGSLERQLGRFEEQRPDFVLGTQQAVKAVDDSRGRAGGTLFAGETDATNPMYLATFDYRVSDDASGSFVLKLRMENDNTFLHNGENQPIGFTPVNATIKVGAGGARTNR